MPPFRGEVDGSGRLPATVRDDIQAALYARRGQEVEIVIRKPRRQRSTDINAYWHAVPFPILAEHFGDSIEGIKLALMGECWGWKRCAVTGREVPIKPHTSDMTVEESKFFTDWLIPWALTEHGVVIPLPSECDWEAA